MKDVMEDTAQVEALPALVDRACRALAGARTSAEVLEVRDMAAVAYDAAKSARKFRDAYGNVEAAVNRAQADALLILSRAKMRLADEYDAAQARGEVAGHGGGRNFKLEDHKVEKPTAADIGLRYDEIHEARQIRDAEAADPGVVERTVESLLSEGVEPTKAAVREAIKPHVTNNSGNNEWYTPPEFIEAARAVLGGFDLDPASSEVANRTVKAARFFTADDDGLSQEWPVGRIWCNPPYSSSLIGQFAERLTAEFRRGSSGIVLVNNATETGWFQTLGAECAAVCFPRGRIKYLTPAGIPANTPLQGQALLYFGENADKFEATFGAIGSVFHA